MFETVVQINECSYTPNSLIKCKDEIFIISQASRSPTRALAYSKLPYTTTEA